MFMMSTPSQPDQFAKPVAGRATAIGLLAAGVAIAVGAALPWAWYDTISRENLYGLSTDGPLLGRLFDQPVVVKDGWLVLFLGLVMVIIAARAIFTRVLPRVTSWVVVLLAASLTIFEIAEYVSENGVNPYYTDPHDGLGPGLFVVAGGVLIALVALVLASMRPLPQDTPSSSPKPK